MGREDKQITSREDIERVIRDSPVCRVAMCDGDRPYVVPLCFGLHGNSLYFHSAPAGKKLDLIKANPNVCFEFDTDHELVRADSPCGCGMKYRSVVGYGLASIVESKQQAQFGLQVIVRHYGGPAGPLADERLNRTVVFKVEITEMTARKSGY